MNTTKICEKCGNDFLTSIKIDGKLKSLKTRKFCTKCSPYRGNNSKKLVCKGCGSYFPCRVGGKGFYNRSHCFECVPFGQRLIKRKTIEIRTCIVCSKKYEYLRKKGHRATRCNSCATVVKHVARKKMAIDYKGGKCVCCGYNKYYGSLDFHHIGKKDFAISRNVGKKWECVLAELDKCVLLCRNCHGEVHAGIRGVPNESKVNC